MSAQKSKPVSGIYRPSYMVRTKQPEVAKLQREILTTAHEETVQVHNDFKLIHYHNSRKRVITILRFHAMIKRHGNFLPSTHQFIPLWLEVDEKFGALELSAIIEAEIQKMLIQVLKSPEMIRLYEQRIYNIFRA